MASLGRARPPATGFLRRVVLGVNPIEAAAPTAVIGQWVITQCALRGSARGLPARWRTGYLRSEPERFSWFQSFRLRRRPVHFDPAALTVDGVRQPARPDDELFFRGEIPSSSWTIVRCHWGPGDDRHQVEFGLLKRHADVLLSRLDEGMSFVFAADPSL
ncbi:MAG TPA: hypothetical protein VKQ71_11905 [Acidimicrobiales bacterium]|nr:hypothetical protein [Acidimicrobiales bacterium]